MEGGESAFLSPLPPHPPRSHTRATPRKAEQQDRRGRGQPWEGQDPVAGASLSLHLMGNLFNVVIWGEFQTG